MGEGSKVSNARDGRRGVPEAVQGALPAFETPYSVMSQQPRAVVLFTCCSSVPKKSSASKGRPNERDFSKQATSFQNLLACLCILPPSSTSFPSKLYRSVPVPQSFQFKAEEGPKGCGPGRGHQLVGVMLGDELYRLGLKDAVFLRRQNPSFGAWVKARRRKIRFDCSTWLLTLSHLCAVGFCHL